MNVTTADPRNANHAEIPGRHPSASTMSTPPAPNRLLIIRLSAIGDIVMASGLLPALRPAFPQARFNWLVQPEARDLLMANPLIDEVITWPRSEWRRLFRAGRWFRLTAEISRFARDLRRRRFDVVIDAQGLLKSALLARLTRAPRRIGLGSKEGGDALMTEVIAKPRDGRRIASEYRHLAAALGGDVGAYRMYVALDVDDREYADKFVRLHSLAQGYVVICPFTTRPQKHWIASYWPVLIARLRQETGLGVVMLGGPSDVAAAASIANGTELVNAVGQTRLRQAAALIERARLLIGVDTGLMHMGTAFMIPTIALFGSTCPYLETDSPRTTVLYKALSCSPCRRHPTCGGAYTCMQTITVEEVAATARQLLRKA